MLKERGVRYVNMALAGENYTYWYTMDKPLFCIRLQIAFYDRGDL